MTLQEKMENTYYYTKEEIDIIKEEGDKLKAIEIRDEFAICFAEWFLINKEYNKSKTSNELLEIYKKTL